MQHLARHQEAPPTFDTRGKTRLRLGRRKHDLLDPPERRGSGGTGCSLLLAQQSRRSTRNTHWRERCICGICEGAGGVQGALTLFCGGVAQTCHDDPVVELKEQLIVEEVDGERQEGKVKEEGGDRVKENAPWMTWR